MPWTVKDVDAHAKGLTPKQKTLWVKVANSALKRCEEQGGNECDAAAIRQANAIAKRMGEADALLSDLAAFAEVGRSLSSKTEHALRSAVAALQAVLAQVEHDAESDAQESDAEPDLATVRTALAEALAELREQATAQTQQNETPPAAESADIEVTGDLVPLVEKAVRRDGTVPVKVIAPGWGSSGYYAADVLKRDGPKVFTRGLHMYADHPTLDEDAQRPERSIKDLMAVLETGATWRDDPKHGPGLYADAKVMPQYAEHLEALAPHIGVSIRALGKAVNGEAEGRKGPVVESLTQARSVDFVTAPGAGGKVLELFEAARQRPAAESTTGDQGGTQVDEEQARALREAVAGLEQQNRELTEQVKRQAEALLMRDIRDVVQSRLAEREMPDLTRARLAESLPNRAPVKDGTLDREAFVTLIDEAVKAELAYLAQATGMGSGRIRGFGRTEAPSADDVSGSLEESFKTLLGSDSLAKIAAGGR